MFRDMRRNKLFMPAAEAVAILESGSNGVLACAGDEGYPYAVPLNYVYWEGRIYFHSALEGHKIDAIRRSPKVSFAVVAEDTIISEDYTSLYRSVIAFGTARIVSGAERIQAFTAMIEKYCGDRPEEEKRRMATECERALLVAIDVEHLTGKDKYRGIGTDPDE